MATYYTYSLYSKNQALHEYRQRGVKKEPIKTSDVTASFRRMLMSMVSVEEESKAKTEAQEECIQEETTEAPKVLSRKEIVLQQEALLNSLVRKVPNERLGVRWTEDDSNMIKTTIEQLGDKFLMVVVGEFNSGKSAFINSLLGGRFVQEGILPTTDNVCKISFGPHEEVSRNANLGYMQLKVPVPWLKDVNVVDTPGTNALAELGHQAITERFLPQSDLVVFVTSAERPLTESERQIIKKIKEWKRKMVVVVNKADLFQSEQEKAQVLEYVRSNLEDIWPGNDLIMYGVSARQAQLAKLKSVDSDSDEWERIWAASNLGAVERYVFQSLDSVQKLKWKLMKPQNVANHAIALYADALTRKTDALEAELSHFSSLGKTVEEHHKKLWDDFQRNYVDQFDQAFNRLVDRATGFVDHHVNFTSLNFFLNPTAVQQTFREEVCVDFQQDIEGLLVKLTDWLTESRSRIMEKVHFELNHIISQTDTILESMKKHPLPHSKLFMSSRVGEESTSLKLQEFRANCKGIIARFSTDEIHSRQLVDNVRNSLYQMAGLEASAAVAGILTQGLLSHWITKRSNTGAAHKFYNFVAGPSTSLADELASPIPMLSLIIGGTSLALWGANTMHYRREQVKRALARDKDMVQARLLAKVQSYVEEKVQGSVDEMTQWLHPFLEAVQREERTLETMRQDLKTWQTDVRQLNEQIETAAKEWEKEGSHMSDEYLTIKQPVVFPKAQPLCLPPTLNRSHSLNSSPPQYMPARGSISLERSHSERYSTPYQSPSPNNPPYYQYVSPAAGAYPDLSAPKYREQYQPQYQPQYPDYQPQYAARSRGNSVITNQNLPPRKLEVETSAPPAEDVDLLDQVTSLPAVPTHTPRNKETETDAESSTPKPRTVAAMAS